MKVTKFGRKLRKLSLMSFIVNMALVPSIGLTGCMADVPQPMTPNRPDKIDGKSLEDLTNEIEANPKNYKAYFLRGRLHQDRDERDNAIDDYTKAIEFSPDNVDIYIRRSEMYAMTNKAAQALADADKVVALYPKWSNAYDQRARVEWIGGKYDLAIKDCLQAIALDPRNGRAISNLTQSFDELGQHQNAINSATYGIDITEEDDMSNLKYAYQHRALAYIHAHQIDQARQDLADGLRESPNDSQLYAYLALANAIVNRMDDAKYCIAKTIALESFPPRGYRLRAEMYRAGGYWAEAIKDYSTSTSLEPDYGPGFMQRAIAEIALGQYVSAESDLKKSIALRPTAIDFSYLALVSELVDNHQAADQNIQAAFAIVKDLPMNYVNRARIFLHRGELTKAAEDCNQALKLDPYLADAYATVALVMERNGKHDDAVHLIQAAYDNGWHDWSKEMALPAECKLDQAIAVTIPSYKTLKPETFTQVDPDSAP